MTDPERTPDLTALALGAGVQSSTLLMLMIDGVVPKPDIALFADTQGEPEHVYEYLAWLEEQAAAADIPVERVTAGSLEEDILNFQPRPGKTSQPSIPVWVRTKDWKQDMGAPMRRFCTHDYKIQPQTKRIRELLGLQPGQHATKKLVHQIFGISTDEIIRMKDSRVPWIVNKYPLIDLGMSRTDCLNYMADKGHPEPAKSACYFCPFREVKAWAEMKVNDPLSFERACDFDDQIRRGKLKGAQRDAFLLRALIPLRDYDFARPLLENRGQSNIFDMLEGFNNECEGMCGI